MDFTVLAVGGVISSTITSVILWYNRRRKGDLVNWVDLVAVILLSWLVLGGFIGCLWLITR